MKIIANPWLSAQFRAISAAKQSIARNADRAASDSETISPLGNSISAGDHRKVDREAVARIMAGKSLRNIRYSELVAVAEKLRDAGQLVGKDYLDFIGPSPEFSQIDGSRNPNWDAAMDYIGRHEMNLAIMIATSSEQRFIDFERHLLSLYKSFEP
jgi:hypothetical protein